MITSSSQWDLGLSPLSLPGSWSSGTRDIHDLFVIKPQREHGLPGAIHHGPAWHHINYQVLYSLARHLTLPFSWFYLQGICPHTAWGDKSKSLITGHEMCCIIKAEEFTGLNHVIWAPTEDQHNHSVFVKFVKLQLNLSGSESFTSV